MSVTGEVKVKYKKAKGKGNLWSLLILDGGSEEWYSCGFDEPKCEKGDKVSFDTYEDQYGVKCDPKTIKVLDASPKQHANKSAKSFKGNARDDYWAEKEKYDKQVRQPLIMMQNATGVAAQLFTALQAEGAIQLPAKKAEKFDIAMQIFKEIRDDLLVDYLAAEAKLERGEDIIQDVPFTPQESIDVGDNNNDGPSSAAAGDWD